MGADLFLMPYSFDISQLGNGDQGNFSMHIHHTGAGALATGWLEKPLPGV